jgi:hypothetical protein
MKCTTFLTGFVLLLLTVSAPGFAQDPGWPRKLEKAGGTVIGFVDLCDYPEPQFRICKIAREDQLRPAITSARLVALAVAPKVPVVGLDAAESQRSMRD